MAGRCDMPHIAIGNALIRDNDGGGVWHATTFVGTRVEHKANESEVHERHEDQCRSIAEGEEEEGRRRPLWSSGSNQWEGHGTRGGGG